MTRYVPTSTLEVAVFLSDALWALSRPPHVRSEKDTSHMFGCVTMTDGSVWLAADDEFEIPLHPEAILDGIADILQPWIDSGHLPAGTNDELSSYIEANRGGNHRFVPYALFPQLFKDQSKTADELRTLGLLPKIP